MASISDLRTYRTALYTAQTNLIKTGRTGNVSGSFSFENWTIEQINAEIDRVEIKIARRLGIGAKRTKPNFND